MNLRWIFVLTLLAWTPLPGSFEMAVTFGELKRGTHSLTRAMVISKRVEQVNEIVVDPLGQHRESNTIYTIYELQTIETLYGKNPREVFEVYMEGGMVDGRGVRNTGSFHFSEGWEVLLHLRYDEINDWYYTTGGASTAFKIEEIGGSDFMVNLSDRKLLPLSRIPAGAREQVSLDDWVRPQRGPAVTSYAAVRSLFR